MKAKVISLTDEKFQSRLSLHTCRQVLRAKDNGYSDEDILKIRDALYALADIDYEYYQATKYEAKIIEIDTNRLNETESHTLHPRKHRRAS
jgi:hypothetical protein